MSFHRYVVEQAFENGVEYILRNSGMPNLYFHEDKCTTFPFHNVAIQCNKGVNRYVRKQTFEKWSSIHVVMTPLPTTRSEPYSRPDSGSQPSAGKSKGKGKNKHGAQSNSQSNNGTPTIKELLSNMPENCSSKLPSGKWLCVFFNRGLCKHQKKSQCHLGLHQCYYKGCTEKRPYIECKH